MQPNQNRKPRLSTADCSPAANPYLTLNQMHTRSSARTPQTLVGRRPEWERLCSSWERASAGESHLFLISGEAGIGKTHLAEELLTWADQQGIATARTRSYGAEGRLALAPVTEWLRSDDIRQSLRRLADVWLTEIARLLPELLDERPNLPRPQPMTEFGQRQRFFEALARGVLAAPQPLLLLIDDLQWCDQRDTAVAAFSLALRSEETCARHRHGPPGRACCLPVRSLNGWCTCAAMAA